QNATIGSWAIAKGDLLAFSLSTPTTHSELYLKQGAAAPRPLTEMNKALMAERRIADVGAFSYRSVDGMDGEAFPTRPAEPAFGSKHPLIVMFHGGPHGQQGPAFNSKAQVYAAKGWAALMVNYRGSTGYGQKFADAIFNDQDGGEARDVLAGIDA